VQAMCKFIKVVVALLLIEERARLGIRRKEVMSVVKETFQMPPKLEKWT
jgi:hypothetical protein